MSCISGVDYLKNIRIMKIEGIQTSCIEIFTIKKKIFTKWRTILNMIWKESLYYSSILTIHIKHILILRSVEFSIKFFLNYYQFKYLAFFLFLFLICEKIQNGPKIKLYFLHIYTQINRQFFVIFFAKKS